MDATAVPLVTDRMKFKYWIYRIKIYCSISQELGIIDKEVGMRRYVKVKDVNGLLETRLNCITFSMEDKMILRLFPNNHTITCYKTQTKLHKKGICMAVLLLFRCRYIRSVMFGEFLIRSTIWFLLVVSGPSSWSNDDPERRWTLDGALSHTNDRSSSREVAQ